MALREHRTGPWKRPSRSGANRATANVQITFDKARGDQFKAVVQSLAELERKKKVIYKKFPGGSAEGGQHDWQLKAAKCVFAAMPERMLVLAGKLLYPHIG